MTTNARAAIFQVSTLIAQTLLLGLVMAAPVVASESAPVAEKHKSVLLLFSEESNLHAQVIAEQSIRSTLKQGSPVPLEVYSEYLDFMRTPVSGYEKELVALLRRKYEGRKFDLVIAVLPTALGVLLKNQPELFPDTPVVFFVIDQRNVANLDLGPNVTGVWGEISFKPNLDLALTLDPLARKVAVLVGVSEFDKYWTALVRKDFLPYEGRLEITYLVGLTIAEQRQALASLLPHTIVFFVSATQDKAGNNYDNPDVLRQISSASNAPIYGTTDAHLGTGIVGGSIFSFEALGVEAARVALRILTGEKPKAIAPHGIPNVYLFDWRQLRRWGIDESKLPTGSIVRFKDPTFWEQYKWHIVGAVSLLIVETLLIVVLMINLRRRRQAEKDNEHLAQLAQVEHKRLDEVISNVPGIVWESRSVGETDSRLVSFVSNHVEKMLGYSVEEWLSTPGFAMTIVAEEDRERTIRESQAILDSGKGGVLQFRWVTKDGRMLWVESQVAVLNDEEGKPIGLRGVTMDVTDRKRAELEATRQRTELAHLSRVTMVGGLSSSLAHELQQPLGAILRNTEAAELFLQDPAPDLEELRAILADIRKDDQRAGAVIDRMRSMLKRREVEYSLVDLNILVSEVISLVRSDADARRVRLALDASSLLPPVSGDRVQLQQVLLNLLINAMDAVNDSAPEQRVVSVRVQSEGTQVQVVVRDTGHGIPIDKLPQLFDPFFTTKANGLGMGLPISRMIIEAHGGSIRAANDPGAGASFYLTLPMAKEAHAW